MTKERILEIANQLPSSWNELKVKDYYKLLQLDLTSQSSDDEVFNKVDSAFPVIMALSDATVEELEDLVMNQPVAEANKIFNKIIFFSSKMPDVTRLPKIEVKSINQLTYNDFANYMQFKDMATENLHRFVLTASKKDLTDEDALNTSVEEALACFFLFVKTAKKPTNRMLMSLTLTLLKLKLKAMFGLKMWKKKKS